MASTSTITTLDSAQRPSSDGAAQLRLHSSSLASSPSAPSLPASSRRRPSGQSPSEGSSSAPSSTIWIPRLILSTIILSALLLPALYQPTLTNLWHTLLTSRIYTLSTLETLETMLCYFILEPLYTYKFAHSPERRIDRRGPAAKRRDTTSREIPFKMKRPSARGWEMLTYAAPLLAMDLSMIKKFAGVDVAAIRESGGYPAAPSSSAAASGIPGKTIHATFLAPTLHNFSWSSPLQLHRALPLEPPTSRRLLLELATAFFLYDALFFIIHILFHRIALLSAIHSPHHRHAEMHPQVTNRLSVAERLSLVLMANFALNGIGAHVLTRTLFVPLFVYLLIDVHSGLDLEWGYDKVLPWGMGAGARKHARHHREGKEGFAPFFGWWDGLAERLAW